MNISWDLFTLLFFATLAIYGMLIGRTKILGILVNAFVALAVTMIVGDYVYDLVSNFAIISNNLAASAFGVKTFLLVLITAVLTLKSEISGLDTGSSLTTFETGVYGIFLAGLVLSSALSFMTNGQRLALDSNFANLVYSYQILFIAVPIVWFIASPYLKK